MDMLLRYIKSGHHLQIRLLPFLLLAISFSHLQSQQVSRFRVGLILPIDIINSTEKLEEYASASDLVTASKIKLSDESVASLDFYQGLMLSLNTWTGNAEIELSIYDNHDNDSITKEILKKEELKQLDVIIGSMSVNSARLVADFCKRNRIVNIQPFAPSKSLTTLNPYHIKLAPTIDSHIDALFQSVVDSFSGANVIVYSPNNANSRGVAARIDSLFREYNKTAIPKFTVVSLNTKDMMWNGQKTTVKDVLKPGKTNVLFLTSFEESFVNGTMRLLFDSKQTYNLVVYGMPNWLDGDILRLDYLNHFSSRLSGAFFADTSKTSTQEFILQYSEKYGSSPTASSFLGYDVMNFLLPSLNDYGRQFPEYITTQRFKGVAYTFDIGKDTFYYPSENIQVSDSLVAVPTKGINYYENHHVNVFVIRDYQIVKIR